MCSAVLLAGIAAAGLLCSEGASVSDFSRKNLAPNAEYLFGTDWLGRDMFLRTLAGLSMSIRLGLLTATVSAGIALALGLLAAMGRTADLVVSGLIDLVMGIPHMLLLILISCACQKGFAGVAVGISLTHWPSLARLIRGEVLQLKESQYVKISSKLGMSRFKIACTHMLPHLLPQFLTGLILMFPHAILHEASITFLGFGLPPEEPAVGIILSESMKYLITGKWWLAVFPGLLLTATVLLFEALGHSVSRLLSPGGAHE
ncbi:ABC transporter permease [Clostridium sp. M62/1]|nr:MULTISPECIES: ABC transporter permease [unclassified Clostridium]UEB80573.1 ABC transporter permease [Clostridium sp. M62/1]